MARVLLTAFAPFAHWEENSSWLALQSFTLDLPDDVELTTRRYAVDYSETRQQLERDLENEYDFAIHLGQSALASSVELEVIALNAAEFIADGQRRHQTLCSGGPTAYQSTLPVESLCDLVNESGVPCRVSHHAGTYLCNAIFYWSQHISAQRDLTMQSLFIHLPLAPVQMADTNGQNVGAPLTSDMAALALRRILQRLVQPQKMA